jgi:hypothetical protein
LVASPHRFALKLLVGVMALWLVGMFALMRMSALPEDATGTMLVVFEPGITEDAAFAAITRAEAKLIRKTSLDFIWMVDGSAGTLKREGVIGAYRELPISPTIAGCVAVVDAKVANLISP